jgi:hypothetical protein
VRVTLEVRKLVRILFAAGGATDAIEAPLQTAQRAAEVAKAGLGIGGGLARADPRRSSAKRAVEARVNAIRRDLALSQYLSVRL